MLLWVPLPCHLAGVQCSLGDILSLLLLLRRAPGMPLSPPTQQGCHEHPQVHPLLGQCVTFLGVCPQEGH